MKRTTLALLLLIPLGALGAKRLIGALDLVMLSADGVALLEEQGQPTRKDALKTAAALEAAREEWTRQRLQDAQRKGRLVERGVQRPVRQPARPVSPQRLFACQDPAMAAIRARPARCAAIPSPSVTR